VLLDIFAVEPELVAARPGQVLLADKNYYGQEFERMLGELGLRLLRPAPLRSAGGAAAGECRSTGLATTPANADDPAEATPAWVAWSGPRPCPAGPSAGEYGGRAMRLRPGSAHLPGGLEPGTRPRAVTLDGPPEDASARGDQHPARIGDRQGPQVHLLAQAR
jgi:hypothetical protein